MPVSVQSLPAAVAALALWLVASGTSVAAPPTALLADTLQAEDRAALAEAVQREGDPLRGSNVFHGRQMACTQCHVVGDGAAPLGPSLAAMPEGIAAESLVEYLIESVLDPSAVVRPAHRAVTILTDEGQSITGLVARETAAEVTLRDATGGGREITIPTAAIDERVPATVSLMPAGLANLLADRQQFLDLVAYLAAVAKGGPARAAERLRQLPRHARPTGIAADGAAVCRREVQGRQRPVCPLPHAHLRQRHDAVAALDGALPEIRRHPVPAGDVSQRPKPGLVHRDHADLSGVAARRHEPGA